MRIAACLLCVVFGTSCSAFIDNKAAASTYRILLQSTRAAERQADVELARAALPGGMLQLEAFSLAYPDHHGFKALHADAYCQYAVAFVFDDWEDAKLGGRAAEAATIAERLEPLLAQCAALNRARLPPALQDPESRDARLAEARREDAAALLWIATTDAVRIAIDPLRNFGRLGRVEALLTRCSELAPGLQRASAELLLASLAAGRGAVFGGSDGHELFQRARALAGDGALMVDVMYARGTAVARKDRTLFTRALQRALTADVTRWPERRLDNELARRKARRYLAAIDTLIP